MELRLKRKKAASEVEVTRYCLRKSRGRAHGLALVAAKDAPDSAVAKITSGGGRAVSLVADLPTGRLCVLMCQNYGLEIGGNRSNCRIVIGHTDCVTL
jgi:hypothetical protein